MEMIHFLKKYDAKDVTVLKDVEDDDKITAKDVENEEDLKELEELEKLDKTEKSHEDY